MLDSVTKVSKNYYTQLLLEESKFEIKNTKMENVINDDLEQSSHDDDTENESDHQSNNE